MYYLTPTELESRGRDGRRGGSAGRPGAAGSLAGSATDLTFVLTDGETEITALDRRAHQLVPGGSGAVVEGSLRADGVFEAEEVLVKHDETYVAPSYDPSP